MRTFPAQWVLLTHEGEDQLVQAARHQWLVRTKEFSAAIGDPGELAEIVASSLSLASSGAGV